MPAPPDDPRRLYVREWRELKALTQEDLERLSGVTQSTISQLENPQHGRKSYPSTRRKLAAALGIRPDDLFWPPERPATREGA